MQPTHQIDGSRKPSVNIDYILYYFNAEAQKQIAITQNKLKNLQIAEFVAFKPHVSFSIH